MLEVAHRAASTRSGPGETGIAVSHGAAVRLATGAVLGWPAEQFRTLRGLDNCGWAVLHEHPLDGVLRLEAYNRDRVGDTPGDPISHRRETLGNVLRVRGGVAQLVAHLHGMQGVRGSSPLTSTRTRRPGPQDRAFLLS